VAFTPYIFVITVRLLIFSYSNRRGEEAAAEIVKKYQEKIYSILWFLVNTLYFPVISVMLSGVDCTSYPTDNTLDANPTIICFRGKHIGIIVCSMLAMIIYYPAASFAQSQTQNISDIKFKPKIVFIMLQGKLILAAIAIFFTNYAYLYLSVVLVVQVAFFGLNAYFRPCLVDWVNWLRAAFFALGIWATVCSFIAEGVKQTQTDSVIPFILFVVGWGFIGLGFPVMYVIYNVRRRAKLSSEGMKTKDKLNRAIETSNAY